MVMFWAIWKERNKIIFEDATFSSLRLKLYVILSLFTWAGFIPNVDLSLLLDCFCIVPMAMPGMLFFWAGLYVSFLFLAFFCWS